MMPSGKTCPSNGHWMIKTLIKIPALNAALFLTVMHLRCGCPRCIGKHPPNGGRRKFFPASAGCFFVSSSGV